MYIFFSLGARESDYPATEEVPETESKMSENSDTTSQETKLNLAMESDSIATQADSLADDSDACIGRVTLVSCATGSEAPGPPLGEFIAPKSQSQMGIGKVSVTACLCVCISTN